MGTTDLCVFSARYIPDGTHSRPSIRMSCTWLTRQEAADYLRIDQSTLWRWQKQGKIKVFKADNVVRICLAELLKVGEIKEPDTEPTIKIVIPEEAE